jgi:hypothetical protein
MDYQIFIPDATGCSPDLMREVGLEDLLDGGTSLTACEVTAGPAGRRGVCFWFGDHPHPGFHKDDQLWTPCTPRGDKPAGRFWMGQARNLPPLPREMQRTEILAGGQFATLGDGNEWLIPVPRRLPSIYGLDELGRPTRKVKSIYRDWQERAWEYWEIVVAWKRGGGGDLTIQDAWRFMVDSLTMNYRVNQDIASWLGVIDDTSILKILDAVFELGVLNRLEAQKKKTGDGIPAT